MFATGSAEISNKENVMTNRPSSQIPLTELLQSALERELIIEVATFWSRNGWKKMDFLLHEVVGELTNKGTINNIIRSNANYCREGAGKLARDFDNATEAQVIDALVPLFFNSKQLAVVSQ